jgi:capsular exopolysaccharide synthesis family protein
MSALSFPHRPRPTARRAALMLAAGFGVLVLGLVCGRIATSHYEKTALEAAIGLPALGLLGTLAFRRPSWAVVGLAASLALIPSYAAPAKLHFVIHPMLVIAVVLAVAMVLRAVAGRRSRLSGVDVCVALFVAAMVIAVMLGPRSWKEASSQLWVWVIPYIGGRTIGSSKPLKETFAKTLVFGATVLTPFAIAEAAGLGNPFFSIGTGGPAAIWAHSDLRAGEGFRVETAWGHPIAYSMFVAVAIVFALVLLGGARSRRERLIYLGAIGALLIDEALSLSRAGWVALGVAVLLLAAGRRRGGAGRAARRAIVAGVAALLALAVAFPSVATVPLSLVGLQNDAASTNTAALSSTAGYRTGLYAAAFKGGVASLFGNSPSKLANSVQTGNSSIDSEYLLLLDQWGAVVTVAFLLIVGGLAIRSLADQEDEWTNAFTVSAVGCAVALASVALITQQEYLIWLLIGLGAAPKPLRHSALAPPVRLASQPPAARPRVPVVRERTNLEVVSGALRRRWWIIALCPVIAGGAALEISKQQQSTYTAASSLLFSVPNFDKILYGVSFESPSIDPNRAAATNVKLATLPVIAQRTAVAIGGVSADRVAADVSLSEQGKSAMYAVSATDPNPGLAARIADTYARQYLLFRKESERARIAAVATTIGQQLAQMTPSERQSVRGQGLQRRAQRLAVVSALQTGDAELVADAAVPRSPSFPHNSKTAKYGAIVGLLIGFLLVFWIGRRDRRIRDATSVEDAYGVPLIGTVSDEQAGTLGGALIGRSLATADAYDRLRASLRYFNVDREIHTLMVTSAGAREGRSTVSLQLAIAEAMAGAGRVVLLEADLRRPSIAAALGEAPLPGLSEVLTRRAGLRDALRTVPVGRSEDGRSAGATISVLPAGAVPPNSLELIESESMTWLLNTLAEDFDLIVIDSPPVSVFPDAIPLLGRVSGVVVVGRIGLTTPEAARVIREQLAHVAAHTLGVVAMSVPGEKLYRFRLRRRRPSAPRRGASLPAR